MRIYMFLINSGLWLDFVKPGSGTTNDGNTARRFFEDSTFTAKVTGLKEEVLIRCKVILVALSTRNKIDPQKFRIYAFDTAKLLLQSYGWYYMPPAVHKVLIHGAQIMSFFDLPIGFYSEEAQEARNKDFRYIREHHTRKSSRILTNTDIIHHLLLSSDPYINSLRQPTCLVKKKDEPEYHPNVAAMFV